MTEILNLKFDNNNNIAITSNHPLDEVYLYEDINIYLKTPEKSYILTIDCFHHEVLGFRGMLQDTLNNRLPLHPSINEDIGFLWNQELHNDEQQQFIYEEHEGQQFWVGLKNGLWITPGDVKPNLKSWLYNDKNGNIIFEITPAYYWHFQDPEPEETDYIPYEEFMKNYKPFFIKKISKSVAKEWLQQIENLVEIVETNEKTYRATHEKSTP